MAILQTSWTVYERVDVLLVSPMASLLVLSFVKVHKITVTTNNTMEEAAGGCADTQEELKLHRLNKT
uniref:Uncharacterized protein n=1 Tax=Peronospora matthiolae TaxID=2874970 RepID=A0AAV1UG85_9STRA